LGLSVVIEEIKIVITKSETCLTRGHYSFGIRARLISLMGYGVWRVEIGR